MINNRQNGRRRGRGGPQVRNGAGGGGVERGNRIDNRARGNAAQLHEKYRNLARDAQTQGDRVMTEYYLQFADHYFRVLSETRARFEEQQPRRQRDEEYDEGGEDGEIYADDRVGQPMRAERYDRGGDRQERYEARPDARQQAEPRQQPEPRQQQVERRPDRDAEQFQPQAAEPAEQGEPRRNPRGRRPRREIEGGAQASEQPADQPQAGERIDVDRLPPAFVAEAPPEAAAPADEEQAPRRRRVRRPKDDGDSVAA